jgi:hypothetical protein
MFWVRTLVAVTACCSGAFVTALGDGVVVRKSVLALKSRGLQTNWLQLSPRFI